MAANVQVADSRSFKEKQFDTLLEAEVVNLEELRTLSWNGVPAKWRPDVWQLLLGYLPSNRSRRETTLQRKVPVDAHLHQLSGLFCCLVAPPST